MQHIWLWIQVWNIYEKVAKVYMRKKKRDLLNSFWWGFGFEKLNSAIQDDEIRRKYHNN